MTIKQRKKASCDSGGGTTKHGSERYEKGTRQESAYRGWVTQRRREAARETLFKVDLPGRLNHLADDLAAYCAQHLGGEQEVTLEDYIVVARRLANDEKMRTFKVNWRESDPYKMNVPRDAWIWSALANELEARVKQGSE